MKYEKIIFEGPNNVGKSTLIKSFKDALYEYFSLDYEIEHVTEKCPNTYEFYDELLSCNEPMIFDRLHVGEMVYPKIVSRNGNLTNNDFVKLTQKHEDDCLIVFVDADYDFVIRANKLKNENFCFMDTYKEKKLFKNYKKLVKRVTRMRTLSVKNHWGDLPHIKAKNLLNAILEGGNKIVD